MSSPFPIPQTEMFVDGKMTKEWNNFFLGKAIPSGYTTFTNLTTDRTLNADSTTVGELADVLGTLIEDLKSQKIISG